MDHFHLDTQNSIFGGVCSGLAKYTGFDVTLIRVVTTLGLIYSPILFLLYLVVAFVAPEE